MLNKLIPSAIVILEMAIGQMIASTFLVQPLDHALHAGPPEATTALAFTFTGDASPKRK